MSTGPTCATTRLAVLRAMLAPAATKQPRSVAELVTETGFSFERRHRLPPPLGQDGLVRRIDESENVWEISHDFVTGLANILGMAAEPATNRGSAGSPRRPSSFGSACIWQQPVQAVVQEILNEESRQADQTEYLHKAARQGDHMAARYFLEHGAPIEAKDRQQGRTPLRSPRKQTPGGDGGFAGTSRQRQCHDRTGRLLTPQAAVFGEFKQVKLLLANGADAGATRQVRVHTVTRRPSLSTTSMCQRP